MLSHAQVPANDGGLALGQAAIGAARLIDGGRNKPQPRSNQGINAMCLGIPGRIEKIDDIAKTLATVDVGGVKRQVNIACIVSDEHPITSCVGDWVLIHVGFAMSRYRRGRGGRNIAHPDRTRRSAGRTRRDALVRRPMMEAKS